MKKIRKNISKVNDYYDGKRPSAHFKASCNCIGREHDQHIFLEIEPDMHNMLTSTFYYECVISSYYTNFWKRIKTAVRILFGSHVATEGEFLFDEEGLKDYIDTLDEARKKLIELRDKKNEEK